MAKTVMLKHPQTGILKKGFYGYSWTTLFFSGFPAIFRGDIFMGLAVILLTMITGWIFPIIWGFFYNKRYTLGLLEQGYEFFDDNTKVLEAKEKLSIAVQ